ncbi:hypothetical protein [Aquincola sp. J276]|uniref:hypothetical protein n=1 Tax=Aquincola sp. J276 TaxID=2898432 RepID=UPI00215094AB|nr:hypothetical protein [Aquincola sp. J276]MCR5868131.1 hypothetical protein [Aquincola sp. J276]
MNTTALVTVVASLLLATTATTAQFVKGNEAVKILPDGSRRVETPPLPRGSMPPPCPATTPACAASGWRMVETLQGLAECTEIYARPTTCRANTFGQQKQSRLWIVKKNGGWVQCQHPDLASKCVSTKALPYSAVQ